VGGELDNFYRKCPEGFGFYWQVKFAKIFLYAITSGLHRIVNAFGN